MAYEFNSTRYIATRALKARDVFNQKIYNIDQGTELNSVWASAILVEDADRESFDGLTQQACLDKKIELGYIKVVD